MKTQNIYVDLFKHRDKNLIILSYSSPIPNGLFHAALEYETLEYTGDAQTLGEALREALAHGQTMPPGSMINAAEQGKKEEKLLAEKFGFRSFKKMTAEVQNVTVHAKADGTITLSPTVHRNGQFWRTKAEAVKLKLSEPSSIELGQALLLAFDVCSTEQANHDRLTP